jgi:hypothetical protein
MSCLSGYAANGAEAAVRHPDEFHAGGKAINEKVRLSAKIGEALIEARSSGADAFSAVEASRAVHSMCYFCCTATSALARASARAVL